MIMEEQNINLEDMLVLKRSFYSGGPFMMLNVSEKGYLQMNQCMLREMKTQIPEMRMEVRYGKDYRVIAFLKNGHPKDSIKFCANGRLKHPEFVNCLQKMGYGLPTKYIIEWDEPKQAWIGILEEVPELKDEQEIVKKVSTKRRKANVKA